MEIESKRYKDTIIFRDYMRTQSAAVKEYEQLKEKLAEKYADNRKMYTSSKNEFIQSVIKIAYDEMQYNLQDLKIAEIINRKTCKKK